MKIWFAALALLFFAGTADAALYAHIESGRAMDVQENVTQADYLTRYRGLDTSSWQVVIVPAGTMHGAALNGDGTFTNPPAPPTAAAAVTVTDFKKRFTFAERTALLSSTDVGVKVFLDELNTAAEVHLDDADTVAGMNYVVSLGLLTAARRDAILSAP